MSYKLQVAALSYLLSWLVYFVS